MRLCVFEDSGVSLLEPLTLTRPAFDLLCGAGSLLARQLRHYQTREACVLVRPHLAALCRETHPGIEINDAISKEISPTVFVNARWLPPGEPMKDGSDPRIGWSGGEVAYVVLPTGTKVNCAAETVDDWIAAQKATLPHVEAGGAMIRHPWHLVQYNPQALGEDLPWFRSCPEVQSAPAHLEVLGSREAVVVHKNATIEPYVVADTRNGPVMIDDEAVVQSYTRLEGPCYVGPRTRLLGTKFRGGTLGPDCRLGGEIEASIVQGYSNKYHDGFLGHAYVGEWVNLGAGTQNSDLRNDYGEVSVPIQGRRTRTGQTKIGAFIGDHTKTGLGTLLNTGTSAGAFCNLLPDGNLLPQHLPSFCLYTRGQLRERTDLTELADTAAKVMARRGRSPSKSYTDLILALYERTAEERRRGIRDHDERRLRRSE